ncbi:type II and III secretion system protein family protein [Escherichia albertii]|uniref:type II and III secretion system protein family protein n=1 Tax=Escherichia albertii TaxID=208962 RepID=UPI000CF64706|nr:pilus assembly protein N-terminal domain-containing protein [Escherichia albertii]EFB5188748.1 tight adherence secretin RcpA [Escherichia albertii]
MKPINILFFYFFSFFSLVSYAGTLTLKPGDTKKFSYKESIGTVFISNPKVADYKIINNNKLVVYAKSTGRSELVVYNDSAQIIYDTGIIVDGFKTDLLQEIRKKYPDANIEIKTYEMNGRETYVISGTVPTEVIKDQIYNEVGSLVGVNKTDSQQAVKGVDGYDIKPSYLKETQWDNVINKLVVIGNQQVNVKLTIVEVTKKFTDALGIEWSSLTLNSIFNRNDLIANPAGVFSFLGGKKGFDSRNISTIINAIKNDSIAKVLAEPNLTVLSGESANFLVGGEIPIVVNSGNDNNTTINYKEYGIKLNVGAKVNSKDKIRISISNELSNINGSYTYNSYSIPTISTRKTSSTIELADGDSFVISGLLSNSDRESLSKIPFIGDIPILGAIARSVQKDKEDTELVVFATVKLVNPVKSDKYIYQPNKEDYSVDELFFNYKRNDEKNKRNMTDKFIF